MTEFITVPSVAGLGAVVLIFIAAVVVHFVFSSMIGRTQADGEEETKRSGVLRACRGSAVLFLVILGVFLTYMLLIEHPHPAFDFANDHDKWAIKLWQISVIAQVSYVAVRIIQALLQLYVQRVAEQMRGSFYTRLLSQTGWLVSLAVYLLGALTALDVLGVSITPLVAGLGIGGIAVALAVQPTLSNLFSGISLVSEGALNEGDFIELDGGPSGFVVGVSWRSTKILDRFNNLIMIPNTVLMESVMTNYYSDSMEMTVLVECGVSYGSDLEQVESVSLEVANQVIEEVDEAVDDFEPVVRFNNFGESNIDFVIVMRAEDRVGSFVVRHEMMKRIHARFDSEGIEINYPVRKLVAPSPIPIEGLQHDSEATKEVGDNGHASDP